MQTKQSIERNITLYRWSITLAEPLFWGPVIILYIQKVGLMSLPEIFFMESIVVFGIVLLEVPSGAFADLVGRKRAVVLGAFFLLGSIISFAAVTSPLWVWISNILWMIGTSLRSGADSSLLYDSLKLVGRESEFQKIQGAVIGNRLFLVGIASLFAGVLAEWHMRLPIILSVPSMVIATALTLFLIEPERETVGYSRPSTKNKLKHAWHFIQTQFGLMKFSVLFVANHKAVKWIIAFSAIIGAASKTWFFTYNPYFELVDLDLAYYGVLFFVLNMVAWISSRYAYRIEQHFSERTVVITLLLLVGLPITLMGSFVSVWMVSLIFFQNIVRGFMVPFAGGFMHKHLDSKNRATVISIKSATLGMTQTISLAIFSFMLGVLPLDVSLALLGIATLVGGYLCVRAYNKIFLK